MRMLQRDGREVLHVSVAFVVPPDFGKPAVDDAQIAADVLELLVFLEGQTQLIEAVLLRLNIRHLLVSIIDLLHLFCLLALIAVASVFLWQYFDILLLQDSPADELGSPDLLVDAVVQCYSALIVRLFR